MNDVFLRQISQWNGKRKKDNRKSPGVSLKPAATKHLCLPGSRKHTARHHSCKMSSGTSSNGERLTLIHKQLPLSLCCCRFRTAVPPNISLPCLANIEGKKKEKIQHVCLLSSEKKKGGKHKSEVERHVKRGGKKTKDNKSRGQGEKKACNI